MTIKNKIFPNIAEMADDAAIFLIKLVDHLRSDDYITLALSGGTTPVYIFNHIAVNYADKIAWNKIKVFWGDERCVPPESEDSNFGMASKNLLEKINIPAENIYRIYGENYPGFEAKRYSGVISEYVKPENGLPKFDLIMLGLGEDGHTASIFPDQIDLFKSSDICMPVMQPVTNQNRITITGGVINNAANVALFATGKSKAAIVAKMMNEGNQKYPAAMVKPVSGNLYRLFDQDAASLLPSGL
ncbi:MAG: 6-phosphogluconolactonase [Bacteroidota bacterium]|nr:6-phosphogluconolactonase [Bacteroidota bacterium]